MATETLTCSKCNAQWNREQSRGRKPRFCPNCVRIEKVTLGNKVETFRMQESKNKDPKYTGKNKWRCHSCGVGVETLIPLTYEPTHRCQKRLRRWLPLELVD